MNKCTLIIILFIASFEISFSQNNKWGTWSSIDVQKKINNWEFGAETELRTIYLARLIERWSLSTSVDYSVAKYLKVGVNYEIMNTLDSKYLNYQFRNRLAGSIAGKYKINNFAFSIREKAQVTFKNDSKRIDSDGEVDTYKINPEWIWRNKISCSYNIKKNPLTPGFSFESFYQLNNPDGNQFDNLRYTVFVDYKFNKKTSVELYGLINKSLDSSDEDYGKYVVGFSFSINL